jgi:hypothetical protein
MTVAHPLCQDAEGHVCQKPSGLACDSQPCGRPAGTHWGPYFCPEHDEARLVAIDTALQDISARLSRMGR